MAALPDILRNLKAVRSRLLEVLADLPKPPQDESTLLGEEEMDPVTELRSTIECVLNDSIQPAIHDLEAVARG